MADTPEHSLHCACVSPADVHTDAQAEVDAVAEVADSNVQIAQIESDTAIKLAQIEAKQVDPERDAEIEALRAEVTTLKALLAPPAPVVPDPAPVVVDAPVVDEPPSLPAPEKHDDHLADDERPKKSSGGGLGFW
jgi:hypothetical protein